MNDIINEGYLLQHLWKNNSEKIMEHISRRGKPLRNEINLCEGTQSEHAHKYIRLYCIVLLLRPIERDNKRHKNMVNKMRQYLLR